MLAISFEFKWDSTTSKQMNLQCQNVLTTAALILPAKGFGSKNEITNKPGTQL